MRELTPPTEVKLSCQFCGELQSSLIGLTINGPMLCRECFHVNRGRDNVNKLILAGFQALNPTLPVLASQAVPAEPLKEQLFNARKSNTVLKAHCYELERENATLRERNAELLKALDEIDAVLPDFQESRLFSYMDRTIKARELIKRANTKGEL